MCGISGIVAAAPLTPPQRAAVARIGDALVHRGPDGDGVFDAEHVALAMRRLAIVDLAGGTQPMFSDDGSIAVVFNGEIYNHAALRAQLGGAFRSGGDGEVIAALYQRHGLDFVDHLRGMFAIALWDENRRRLVLTRDRMGEKPLYLCEVGRALVFASEMKALLRSELVEARLDSAAVDRYFHIQYVPEPQTAITGVRKLDAGTMLVVDVAPWQVREHRYWRMADAPAITGDPPKVIAAALDEAVELATRADVPVGVALSGGLDSSLVAALAARHRPVTAFTVGYAGRPPSDERHVARDFAQLAGLDFHEVEIATADVVDSFGELVAAADDPVADIAGFGYFAVMRAARRHGVQVMLKGQGGDELFWGYSELRAARTAAHRSRLWRKITGQGASPVRFYEHAPDYRHARQHAAKQYSLDFAARLAVAPNRDLAVATDDGIDVALTAAICATYLRGNGIVQGDRLAMASSVELRLPLLDHGLVETIVGLRKSRSDGGLPPKAWLKAAARGLVPDSIIDAPKRGFEPPVAAWHAALFAAHGTMLIDGALVGAGVLDGAAARELAKGAFPSGAISPLSFKALVLEHWWRAMLGCAP
ncbi:asparagine synthase (glutamine-hydrolyzing) [Glacieibacterium frigidum]|uniref:asparagine synthase (glutamine-hydrolyzing) n=1 Tax=Glacieibacterium frigidum TaxID=2593303 RepID=A0A552UG57_9SPHN|nr:asparagine synthase (glutamine-hydrolyzing) [Glacieibacterium frigidum]TRW17195.1 asparagine synthase (glutamine-hydrolyzing) [Glacieibacterium frigidum]